MFRNKIRTSCGKSCAWCGELSREFDMASWVAAWPQKIGATSQNASPAARRYMPGAPEIYFHKPIDNSRLVRSDDPKRKREMRAFAATLAVCFMMMLMYLCQHCSSIEYGYKIEDLRPQR